jgi:hypothetical protein
VPVHKWGKGELSTRIMSVFSLHIYSRSIHLKCVFSKAVVSIHQLPRATPFPAISTELLLP